MLAFGVPKQLALANFSQHCWLYLKTFLSFFLLLPIPTVALSDLERQKPYNGNQQQSGLSSASTTLKPIFNHLWPHLKMIMTVIVVVMTAMLGLITVSSTSSGSFGSSTSSASSSPRMKLSYKGVYVYVYTVCVCVRKKERERKEEREMLTCFRSSTVAMYADPILGLSYRNLYVFWCNCVRLCVFQSSSSLMEWSGLSWTARAVSGHFYWTKKGGDSL